MQIIKRTSFDYLVVVLFVLTSGALIWHQGLSPAISFTIYLFASFIHYNKKKPRVSRNYSFIVVVLSFILFNFLTYFPQYANNSTLGYIFTVFGTYFLISSFDFFYFRKILTDIVFILCCVAIPLYLMSELELLPTVTMDFGDATYTMFGPFPYGWPYLFHRFAGIWHEPGACMIVLALVLWLYFDDFCKLKLDRENVSKLAVIFLGLLLTKSTGAYMNIMLLIAFVTLNLKMKKRTKYLIYPLVALITIGVILVIFNSDVVQEKLFSQDSQSKLERLSDINALYQMANERFWLGYGIGTAEYQHRSMVLGNTADSCGLLKTAADLGWVFLVILLGFVFRNLKRVLTFKESILWLIAFVVLMFNECFMEFPISQIFLFSFYSYKKDVQYSFGKINKRKKYVRRKI